MQMTLFGATARRCGKTTAFIDLAIMSARAGAYVQLWSTNYSHSEMAASECLKRLQQTDTGGGVRVSKPANGVPTFDFTESRGRLEFLSGTATERNAARMWTGTLVQLVDCDDSPGHIKIEKS